MKSDDPSTAVAIKAALRVGYFSIIIGLAKLASLGSAYVGLLARLKTEFKLEEAPHFDGLSNKLTFVSQPTSDHIFANWASIGGVFFMILISVALLLPLIRKGYAILQSARIVRKNKIR